MQKWPNFVRRRIEHDDYDKAWALRTEDISNWLAELVVIIVPTIIVAPMFALYAIPSTWERMAALWGFEVLFALMTRLLASPSSDFIFPTTAAYVSPCLKLGLIALVLTGPDFALFSSFL
jgi:hypothetical protein